MKDKEFEWGWDVKPLKNPYLEMMERSHEHINQIEKEKTYMDKEKVDHPQHYNPGKYETIKIIEAYNLGFSRGNVLKYLLRAGTKSSATELEDLEKALWYLNREIDRIKNPSV